MAIHGERVDSYVKYEREIASEFKDKLSSVKRIDEVGKLFVYTITKLLKNINPDLEVEKDDISFNPTTYSFSENLKKQVGKYFENSDLKNIIDKYYTDSINRYKKIQKDENTNFFRKQ